MTRKVGERLKPFFDEDPNEKLSHARKYADAVKVLAFPFLILMLGFFLKMESDKLDMAMQIAIDNNKKLDAINEKIDTITINQRHKNQQLEDEIGRKNGIIKALKDEHDAKPTDPLSQLLFKSYTPFADVPKEIKIKKN